MKSPITGKKMSIRVEERAIEFRKESFDVLFHFYVCEDSGEQFTSTELDEINMTQVYNQYRDKYNLPFPEEIVDIREQYELSATKMSEILGFGINSYRNYENGEVPSSSNGKLIQLACDPKKFRQLVEIAEEEVLSESAKEKLTKRIDKLIEQKRGLFSFVEEYYLDGALPNEFTGYKRPSLNKLTEMVVFFTQKLEPWKTAMNKLLFYADFLSFKRTCYSMSGAQYRAITMGPVPNNFNSIFEYMSNNNHVDIWEIDFQNGFTGEKFKKNPNRDFQAQLFNEVELQVLENVVERFKDVVKNKTSEIVEISHKETAWLKNQEERKIISYKYAFDLNQI